MDCKAIPIGELLPHGPEMTLIDRLVEYSPQRSVATVTIERHSRFFAEPNGVPAWVGIEYMAQTIAARAGYEARLRGEPPADWFSARHARLSKRGRRVSARCGADDQRAAVGCRREARRVSVLDRDDDRVLATAVVNTYQPAADELEAVRRGAGT